MSESEQAIRHVLAEIDGATGMIEKIIAERTMGLPHYVEDIRNLLAELDDAQRDAAMYKARYKLIRSGHVYIEGGDVELVDFYAAIGEEKGKYYKDMKDFDADIDAAITFQEQKT